MRLVMSFLFPRSVRGIGRGEGEAARKRAEQELVRVRAQTAYYERLGYDLRALRERNHFADTFRASMGGNH